MKCISKGARTLLLGLGLAAMMVGGLTSTASAAPAQDSTVCFPGSDADYPPTGPSVAIEVSLRLLSGHFIPGGAGHIEIAGAISDTDGYCGITYSAPIVLPAKQPNAQGQLIYDIAVPSDFELNAMHHIDVFKRQVKVGNFDFCVNKSGDVAPTSQCVARPAKPPAGNLARTGTNHVTDLVRFGVVLVGLGGAALFVRRRRTRRTA